MSFNKKISRKNFAFKKFQVSAIQMNSSSNIIENLTQASELIKLASEKKAKLVLLPEFFCFIGQKEKQRIIFQKKEKIEEIKEFLSEQARKYQIWLVGGSIPLYSKKYNSEKFYNSSLVWNPKGEICARYDKIHLFKLENSIENYNESTHIIPGKPKAICINLEGITVGLSICYDLRFPELYRSMSYPHLILVPSAFTFETGKNHWEILLRARAIENQCYVLAAAQNGIHEDGRRTWGHSMLIDPWGNILDMLEKGDGIVTGYLDFDCLITIRKKLPTIQHKVI